MSIDLSKFDFDKYLPKGSGSDLSSNTGAGDPLSKFEFDKYTPQQATHANDPLSKFEFDKYTRPPSTSQLPQVGEEGLQMLKGDDYQPPVSAPAPEPTNPANDQTTQNMLLQKGDIPAYNDRYGLGPVDDTRPLGQKISDTMNYLGTKANAARDYIEQGLSQSSLGNIFGGELTPSEPSSRALSPITQSVLRGTGRVTGEVLPYVLGGPIGEAGSALTAGKLAPEFASTLGGRALSEAAGQALLGGSVTAGEEALKGAFNPQGSVGDSLKNIGENTALFGAFGAATPYLGQAAKYLMSRFSKGAEGATEAVAQSKPPLLALPAPKSDIVGLLPAPKNEIAGLLPAPKIAGLLQAPKPPDFIGGFKNVSTPRKLTPESASDRLYRVLDEIAPEVQQIVEKANKPLVTPTRTRGLAPNALKPVDQKQNAFEELQKGIQIVQNYVGHNDILSAYPSGTSVETALADIKAKTGVDLKALADRADTSSPSLLGQLQSRANVSQIGRSAGVFDSKPLESTKPMVDFISKNFPHVPKEELNKLSWQQLQGLAQNLNQQQQVQNVINAAYQAAAKRGHNLDKLFEEATNKTGFLEQAKPIAEQNRFAQTVGAMDRPNIGRGPTQQVPFVQANRVEVPVATRTEIAKPSKTPTLEQVATQKIPTIESVAKKETPITQETPQVGAFKSTEPIPKQPNERGFINTLKNSEKTSEGFMNRLKGAYKPITNEEMVAKANKRVSEDMDKATQYVMNARSLTSEHVTTAHRLIDEFQKAGNFDRAVDVAEKIAEAGTKAGQSIQAFSIYNRLTPQGVLVHAGRIVNRIGKPELLTADKAEKLMDLAATAQTMTGSKEVAHDVVAIAEKLKKGEKITDQEKSALQGFVKDAKQFVGDLAPRRDANPKPPKLPEKRIRDNVIDFMAAQEQAAKDRLRSRGYRVMSGIPVDDFYDWSIVGASRMAKGTVKFADWAEEMVKEFGENIRPYVRQVYDKATEFLTGETQKIRQTQMDTVVRITNTALKGSKINTQEADTIRKMAEQVAKLSGDAKVEATQELHGVLNTLQKAGIGQRLSSIQTIAQLGNPLTHIKNIIGNELFWRIERLNKFITVPIDWAKVNLLGVGERQVTFGSKQYDGWKSFFQPTADYFGGLRRGLKAGWKGVNPEGISSQYELHAPAFSGKWNPLTYLEKGLGASLKGFDYASYVRAKNQTLVEMATLRATNEGLKGPARNEAIRKYVQQADDHILQIADQYGKYVTFQDNNMISTGAQKFKQALNLNKDFGAGDFILKYARTPGALLMRAIEYSPAGFLRSAHILTGPILRKAQPNTPEVLNSLSRAIVGTFGFSGLGLYLANVGILTGAASSDQDIRELEKLAGKRPNSVNINALVRWVKNGFDPASAKPQQGDRYVAYDWAQPVAMNIALGANVSQALNSPVKKNSLSEKLGVGAGIVNGTAQTLLEQSFLQGIKNTVSAPGATLLDKAAYVAEQGALGFVPSISNQIRKYQDNVTRNTYDPDKLQTFINQIKNKIPGLSETLPPAYDTLGKQKENYQNGGNSFGNVFLNPAYNSEYQVSPEAKMVIDLIGRTNNTTVAPRAPAKSITINGNKYQLTPDEYSQLQKTVGLETAKGLDRVNPNASDKSNVDRVLGVLNDAGQKARYQIEKQHPELKKKQK